MGYHGNKLFQCMSIRLDVAGIKTSSNLFCKMIFMSDFITFVLYSLATRFTLVHDLQNSEFDKRSSLSDRTVSCGLNNA